jgi:hypothetical protein
MGRIRTIKPEFPHSESMGQCSRDARLLFVLLWTLVDDSGRARAASRMLASLLFPYDDDAPKLIDGWLAELTDNGSIVLYEVDGAHYLEVCNWSSHQKIDRPSPSKFPPFDESSRALANPREPSSLDQGPRTKDQGGCAPAAREPSPGDPAEQQKPKRSAPVPPPEDVQAQIWEDWCAMRRGKRAAVTQTAIDGIRREAKAAGLSFQAAIEMATSQGWQGFRADWVKQTADGIGGTVSPRLVAMSKQHIPNMPLGAASCQCQGCVDYRTRRAAQ